MLTRPTATLLGLSLVLLGVATPALAAGTGDVELVPAARQGVAQTAFRVAPDEDSISFELINLVTEPRTVRLYAAAANRSPGGGVGVSDEGSAPWLDLPDAQITLGPEEKRSFTVPLRPRELPTQQEQLGAVVLEAAQGAVTVRVATLVTVEARSALPLPLWAVALAVIVLALAVFGLWVAWRRRRLEAADVGAQDAPPVAPDATVRS